MSEEWSDKQTNQRQFFRAFNDQTSGHSLFPALQNMYISLFNTHTHKSSLWQFPGTASLELFHVMKM